MYKAAGGVSKRIARKEVPAGFISWDIDFPEYDPITFTAGHIEGQPWADPDMKSQDFKPQWNKLDGQINRVSHEGPYRVRTLKVFRRTTSFSKLFCQSYATIATFLSYKVKSK